MARFSTSVLVVAALCVPGLLAGSPGRAQSSQDYLDRILKGSPARQQRERDIGAYQKDQHKKAADYKRQFKSRKDAELDDPN